MLYKSPGKLDNPIVGSPGKLVSPPSVKSSAPRTVAPRQRVAASQNKGAFAQVNANLARVRAQNKTKAANRGVAPGGAAASRARVNAGRKVATSRRRSSSSPRVRGM